MDKSNRKELPMTYIEERRKYEFIKNLEMTLFLDHERNDIESIDYIYQREYDDEIIVITYMGGHEERILTTGNSNGANAKAIINTIYKGV